LTTPALKSCQPVCSGADAAGTSPDLPAITENTGTPEYSAVNITQNNEVDTDSIIIALRCASQDRLKSSGTLFPNYEDVTVKAIQPPNDKKGEVRWRNLKKGGEMSLEISPKKVEKERRKQSELPTTKTFDAPKLLQTKEHMLQRASAPSQPTPAPELLQIQERLAQRASAPMQPQHAARKSTPNEGLTQVLHMLHSFCILFSRYDGKKNYLYRKHIKNICKFSVLNLFSVCQGRQTPYCCCCSGKEPPGSAQCPPPFCCDSTRYFPVNI
jgi:hypothetical protein